MARRVIAPALFSRPVPGLLLVAIALAPGMARAQCTQSGTIRQFEPFPPGATRPPTLSSGFSSSLALTRNASGSPRLLMIESWGYSTLDLTNPGNPTALKYDDLRLDPPSPTTNPVPAFGDAQSYIQTIGVSPDGQRIVSSMTGPAEPTWHNLVGRPDGGEGFGMWGDFGESRASGTVVIRRGTRYVSFATYFSVPLIVSDVSTLTTVNAEFQSLNLGSETTGLPPGYALSAAGHYVLYLQTAGTGIRIIDASTPGPPGSIAAGLTATTLAGVPGDPYARVPKNFAAAADPGDPSKLWVLVELEAWAPAGENSPSYALVFIGKDGSGNFQAPVPAGAIFRVPASAGELWGLSGGSSSLVASNGQLFAIMWGTRQLPSPQLALYSSSASLWAPAGGVLTTPAGFGLAATAAAALAGSGNGVYQYLPTGARAFVVPMACSLADAPASSLLTVWNASAGGAEVRDGDTVFLGDTLTLVPSVLPPPAASPLTEWRFDFDFHAGAAAEDNGTLPRIKNLDNGALGNPPGPPATVTLIGPCDPRAGGVPATGVGCWASVQANAAAGGPDFSGTEPAGTARPLRIGFEATNEFGGSSTAVFTVNWMVPAARVASAQVLTGQPLTSASDGHPSRYKWWFGAAAGGLTVNAACTTASCLPPAGATFYWLTATYANGYQTPDYNGATNLGLPLTPGSVGPYGFSVLSPCRVLDTRRPAGLLGGPAIEPGGSPDRAFPVASSCGIPPDAKALSVNATMTNVTAAGTLLLYRGDGQPAGASSASLRPGKTRANNAIVQLAIDGSGTIKVQNTSAGSFDLILDVNGYFR